MKREQLSEYSLALFCLIVGMVIGLFASFALGLAQEVVARVVDSTQ